MILQVTHFRGSEKRQQSSPELQQSSIHLTRRKTRWSRARDALCVERPSPTARGGQGFLTSPSSSTEELWLQPGAVLWERTGPLEGLTPGALSLMSCVCSHSNQSCSCLESTAGSQDLSPAYSMSKHPAFRQVSVLAQPWKDQRHLCCSDVP